MVILMNKNKQNKQMVILKSKTSKWLLKKPLGFAEEAKKQMVYIVLISPVLSSILLLAEKIGVSDVFAGGTF